MKAIEAGCDIVDTAISSMSLGPGHNPTEALVEMLEGTGFETQLDMKRILRVKRSLREDPAALPRSSSASSPVSKPKSSRARFRAA